MKKLLFVILALTACSFSALLWGSDEQAYADGLSITLDPTTCYSFCWNVPNSAGVIIDMSVPPKYWWVPSEVYVSINGDAYTAQHLPYTYGQFNLSGVVLTDAVGNTITLSDTWHGVLRCSSGRAGGCSVGYNLASGTLLMP